MNPELSSEEIYQQLRQEIDKFPVPYPRSESGHEIELLKSLFTVQEAEIAVHLTILPESLHRIHKRIARKGIEISLDSLKLKLDGLVDKGAIMGKGMFADRGREPFYSLAPFIIGFFEFQVDIITKPFAETAERYMKDTFHKVLFQGKKSQMRTIPISQAVTPDIVIETHDSVREYVRNYDDKIAVNHCVCEQARQVQADGCNRSQMAERCLIFGDSARFFTSRGIGRFLSNREALEVLDRAEQENLILQPQNTQNPGFICCCCADCCGALTALRYHEKPGREVQSNYFAGIDRDACIECEECFEICPMQAISMTEQGVSIDRDRCIGCGICVPNCAGSALVLRKKQSVTVPYKTSSDLYREIMFQRFGKARTLTSYLRYLMGMKF